MLRELLPHAVECLGELLNSDDERIRLEAAKALLDRQSQTILRPLH
jgi:HEAT repeat protein